MWALIRAGAALLLWCVVFVPSSAWAEKRVALIIGNGAYVNVPQLPNPPRDAAAMADMLRVAGFNSVTSKTDLGAEAMRRELRDFSDEARDADIALIYYAGHGIEMNGVNYLIPIDAKMARDVDVEDETISLDRMIRTLEAARGLQFVILDSCRDNPFVRSIKRTIASRSVRSGLGDIDEKALPPNTLIAYAQRAGLTAEDGAGANSPYATALLKHLATPGLDVEFALRRVRDDVLKATNNRQEPFKYGSLGGSEVPLVPRTSAAPGEPPAPPPTALHRPESPAPEYSAATAPELKRQADQEAGSCRRYLPSIGKTVEVPCERAQVAEKTGEVAAPGSKANANEPTAIAKGEEKQAAVAPIAPPTAASGMQAPAGRSVTIPVRLGQFPSDNSRGWLAVKIAIVEESLAKAVGLSGTTGAWVTSMLEGGPAAIAGMRPGDVITSFDGRVVTEPRALARMVGETPPDKTMTLQIWRVGDGAADLGKLLRGRAEAGEAGAMTVLGEAYSNEVFGPQDDTEAVRWYRTAAEAGNARGMNNLGLMYEDGRGVAKDDAEAVRWFQKGAEAGEPTAMANLGRMYENGRGVAKDEAEAVRWYRKGAEGGDATAMRYLGLMYEDGRGVAKDDAEAVRWFQKGAETGDATAMANLGFMYTSGRGVAKDDAEAVRWFQKGAEAGDADAMYDLGTMYQNGRGVAKDDAEAVRWYRKAAEAGDASAMRYLGVMYQNGSGVAKDEAEAVRWYRKGAEAGNASAMASLGFMYENGRGVAKDEAEAMRWYRKGAEAGDADAMYDLAAAYNSGRGVAPDPATASQWMFKVLQGGDEGAYREITSNSSDWGKDFRSELQRRLKEAGVYDGPIDGEFGPSTQGALATLKQRSQ